MKKINLKSIVITLCCVFFATFGFWQIGSSVFAEQSGGTPNSGATSTIKTIYDSLTTLTHGSDSPGDWGDLGAYWNRIRSAGEWVPSGDATESDVADGKFFYKDSRTQLEGTAVSVSLANMYNGSGTGDIDDFTKALGGVDDYNRGASIPTDTFQASWTACNSGNSFCSTSREVAESKDPNTGLVWSPQIYDGNGSYNWFWANNCKTNNGLGGDGSCDDDLDVDCICVKNTGEDITGCEDYDDGNWRLPSQKELMMGYIDGAAGLTNASAYYWSATNSSDVTNGAWVTRLSNGNTILDTKTSTVYAGRCVR